MSKNVRVGGLDARKVSGELFTLTYGALVAQLLQDYETDDAVNTQLDKIGYNMGQRMIDDFLAKNPSIGRCHDLRALADTLARHGFKTYMGITPTISGWSASGDEFSLVMDVNPLTEFVEMPSDGSHAQLRYSQIICGAIRGALEMVHIEVQTWFVQDQLKGDPTTEVRVKFLRRLEDSVPLGDD